MGMNGSRVIEIKNIEERLRECKSICKKGNSIVDTDCPIYGGIHNVCFQGMEFNIGESIEESIPHPMSLHYLVRPKLLLFPDFTLLEDICPESLNDLLEIIKGLSEMALEGGEIGVSYQRVAYKARWGVVGEKDVLYPYRLVLEEGVTEGVYLSPQQMIALSQQRDNPVYDRAKADVFALGIMLIQVIFQESLHYIYDYDRFEIKLKPLLHKLQKIKEEYGEGLSNMFVSMLEIEEEDRVDFVELLELTESMLKPQIRASQVRKMEQSRGNKTPTKQNVSRQYQTPKAADQGNYRNDVSPFRGRFGSNVKMPERHKGTTPERSPQNRSPMRRAPGFQRGAGPREVFENFQQPRQGFSPISRR